MFRGLPLLRPALALLALASLIACGRGNKRPESDAGAEAAPPWGTAQGEPEPRPGMIWIPPGVLLAGTPPDKIPRVADEEMAGEQVVMRGFYIDQYAYPNEVGAIPTTNITHNDARTLCEAQSKRLCTELEIERACKGPSNATYEYGDTYKAATCATGSTRVLVPNGVNTSCQSAFGVHDMHGSVWVWTASQWRRDPSKTNLMAVRGGNGAQGELLSRCANGRGVKVDAKRDDIGARCCAGEPNTFEVALEVQRGEPLKWQRSEKKYGPLLEQLVPPEIRAAGEAAGPQGKFKIDRVWLWHPLGNEELVIGGGCSHPGGHAACGVVIARMRLDVANILAFIPSDWWQPTVGESGSPREVFVHGGDVNGAFRVKVGYAWGRLAIAAKTRKRKHKGERGYRYD